MRQTKQIQLMPLVAIDGIKSNYPDVFSKTSANDFHTSQKFAEENGIPESEFLIHALVKWRESKQIFVLDKDLAEILIATDKIDNELPSEIVSNLVYDCFYVQLPANFLHINNLQTEGGNHGKYDVDGFFYYTSGKSIIIVMMFTSGHGQSLGFDVEQGRTLRQNIDAHLKCSPDVYNLINFFLQIVLYLCADNADIQENQEQKMKRKAPKKKTQPKDIEKDVRKWDVGYRYGAAIRKIKTVTSIEATENESEKKTHEGSHTRKRTHVRRGHWHHVWCGSEKDGSKRLSLKWFSPVVINAEYENVTTIRKIKK